MPNRHRHHLAGWGQHLAWGRAPYRAIGGDNEDRAVSGNNEDRDAGGGIHPTCPCFFGGKFWSPSLLAAQLLLHTWRNVWRNVARLKRSMFGKGSIQNRTKSVAQRELSGKSKEKKQHCGSSTMARCMAVCLVSHVLPTSHVSCTHVCHAHES